MTGRCVPQPIKVLHAPTAVGGNPQGQARALRRLGIDAHSAVLHRNPFNYEADYILPDKIGSFRRGCLSLVYFIKWLHQYDIFHFNAGSSIFSAWPDRVRRPDETGIRFIAYFFRHIMAHFFTMVEKAELLTYYLLRKPVFLTYQGDDARQGDYCRSHFSISIAANVDQGYYDQLSDVFKRKRIEVFSRFCDKIYALNPDLLWVLPRSAEFLPYSNIFLDEWQPQYNQMHAGQLRIAHAPSHRGVKGTELILAAFDALRSEGRKFETLIIENMTHAEARKIYETADVFIDQLYAGWYGGLAVEAMALGKPVMVYIRESDLIHIPEEMRQDLPFIQVTPYNILEKLREVLSMSREELLVKGRKSRAFVEKWHDPQKIAHRLKNDYENALRQRGKLI